MTSPDFAPLVGLARIRDAALDQLAARRTVKLVPSTLAAASDQDPDEIGRAFPDSNAVLTALVLGAYNDMSDAAEAAIVPGDSPLQRWIAISLGVRAWALAHPDEYNLIWGQPVPDFCAPPETMAAGARTVLALLAALHEALAAGELLGGGDVLPMSAAMAANVAVLAEGLLNGLPDWVIARMLVAWTQLHGMLGFEVNGHIAGVAGDPKAFFEHAAAQMGRYVGLSR
jgi:hypothetical protein